MMASKFDIQRIIMDGPEDAFEPLYIAQPTSLKKALDTGLVDPNATAQSIRLYDVTYVFSLTEMVYYHVAQVSDQPHLMLTHCAVCDGGACFSPIVDGVYHHFSSGGLYNSMTILKDEETGSIWHHITGVCLHGPLKGKRLKSYGTAVVSTFSQALRANPNAKLVHKSLNEEQAATEEWITSNFSGDSPKFWDMMSPSVLQEDERLPRMTMGLGVWAGKTYRFYPMDALHNQQNALFDQLDGRQLVVYADGHPQFPRAFYTDAETVNQTRGQLYLSNGWSMSNGLVYDETNTIVKPEYPRQLFARWFGFSLTFPNCDIYEMPK